MKTRVIAAAAVVLVAGLSVARAEEITGRIRSVDDTGGRITLSNGSTYALAGIAGAPYFSGQDLHAGERVRLEVSGGMVTGIDAE